MNDDSSAHFWDKFIYKSKTYGIKNNLIRWHVIHVERYIKANADLPLAKHSQDQLEQYIKKIAHDPNIKDWQYKQILTSLQIVFAELIQTSWAKTFPWQSKMEYVKPMVPDHTIAGTAGKQSASPLTNIDQINRAHNRFSPIMSKFSDHFNRLISEIRIRHYSIHTEQCYRDWLARFILFNKQLDPKDYADKIGSFLEYLVIKRNVSSSTQSQALNALVFFYKNVLQQELDVLNFRHAKKPRNLPVVLTSSQVATLLNAINNPERYLMASLLYGCGMRLMECLRLRILDVDFEYKQILIRKAKGGKDRIVPLPAKLIQALRTQIDKVDIIHQNDIEKGVSGVYLPDALSRKYPNATKELRWAAPAHPCARGICTSLCGTCFSIDDGSRRSA